MSVASGTAHSGLDRGAVMLVPAGAGRGAASRERAAAVERPQVRVLTFAALALYGMIRWGTMLSPAPTWRLLGVFALAVLVVWAAGHVQRNRRVALWVVGVAAVILMFPVSGIPLRWVTHVRIAVTANAIGDGLSALPQALVPYNGVNDWLRMVIVMGAGVLLLDSALMLALAPRPLTDWRRAAAVLPLIALAVIPATLVKPSLPYLQGVILFVLIAAFVWGERLRGGEVAMAAGLAVIAAAVGMIAAPRLDPHSPWVNYQALAANLAAGHPESFDWSQRYGPLHWPRAGHEVLEVQAAHGDYWKAQNLDVFDGHGWVNGSVGADQASSIDPANIQRWTQTLHVTLRAMRTNNVIAAGAAAPPDHVPGNLVAGASSGTWIAPAGLAPGDSYTVSAYDPHPTAAQLQTAGTNYPDQLVPAYLMLFVPVDPAGPQTPARPLAPTTVLIPPFGSTQAAAYGPTSTQASSILRASPYARAYELAVQLKRGALTPLDYVTNVMRYLSRGFRYDENPPQSAYPLETFLFKSKAGYCQQFAGAMALLLRLGGIPARVAAGFTPGSYNSTTHQWIVTDINAHAWVEAWFPHYGWVRFDPTPSAAPALGGHVALPALKNPGVGGATSSSSTHGLNTPGSITRQTSHAAGGGPSPLLVVALVLLGGTLALAVRTIVRIREPTIEQLLAELERALRRCGRPIGEATTLAALEQRFRTSAGAAAYIRSLRLARFAGSSEPPSAAQRRALRGQLRAGLGLGGFVRALWAMPPHVNAYRPVSSTPDQGINSN